MNRSAVAAYFYFQRRGGEDETEWGKPTGVRAGTGQVGVRRHAVRSALPSDGDNLSASEVARRLVAAVPTLGLLEVTANC